MLFTAPVEVPVVARGEQAARGRTEAGLLALHVAAGLRDRQRLVGADAW